MVGDEHRAARRPERSKAGATLESVGDEFSHASTSLSIPMTVISSGTGTPIRRAALRTYVAVSSFAARIPHGFGIPAMKSPSRLTNSGPLLALGLSHGRNTPPSTTTPTGSQ